MDYEASQGLMIYRRFFPLARLRLDETGDHELKARLTQLNSEAVCLKNSFHVSLHSGTRQTRIGQSLMRVIVFFNKPLSKHYAELE